MDWICKAVLTAATVALLLAVAQLFGRRFAGILAGLPTVTGPALIWLALEFGAGDAVEAAIGSVAACALCALFALVYERASRRAGIAVALMSSLAVSVLAAPPLRWLSADLPLALLIAAIASVVVHGAIPDTLDEAAPARRLPGEVVLTAVVSGLVSGAVALAAPQVGPFWSGVLASPPLIAAAVAMHQHAREDHASVRRFLRGYVGGLLGRAAFGAGFALLIAPLGVTAAALLATFAGCAATLVALRLLAWRAGA